MKHWEFEVDKDLNIDLVNLSGFEFLYYLLRLDLINAGSTALIFYDKNTNNIVRFYIDDSINYKLTILFLQILKYKYKSIKKIQIILDDFTKSLRHQLDEPITECSNLRIRIEYNNTHFETNPEQFLPINTAFTVNGKIVAYTMRFVDGHTYWELQELSRSQLLDPSIKLKIDDPDLYNKMFELIGDDPNINTINGATIKNLLGNRGKDIFIDLSPEEC